MPDARKVPRPTMRYHPDTVRKAFFKKCVEGWLFVNEDRLISRR